MNEPAADSGDLATAQRLGESYAALVGGTEWHVDELPTSSIEPRVLAIAEDLSVSANPPDSPNLPPLAEAVNEPTVPPTPIQIIEALLFVGGLPLTAEQAAEAIRGLSAEQFRDCIDSLNRLYRLQNRPYSINASTNGFVLRVSSRFASVRERLFGGPRETRLNQSALDVLSLIAYRQPVETAEIDGARGVDSSTVVRQLIRLGLVVGESKHGPFSTTPRFLEVFRLRDLDDLPQLGEPLRVD